MELDAIFHWKKPLGIPSDAKLSEDTKLHIEWKDLRTNRFQKFPFLNGQMVLSGRMMKMLNQQAI